MNLEMIVRTIQLIIAPAVMITACCIFTNGLLGHYAAIGERLRITVRERVDLLRLREKEVANISGMVATGRLADIDFPRSRKHIGTKNDRRGYGEQG